MMKDCWFGLAVYCPDLGLETFAGDDAEACSRSVPSALEFVERPNCDTTRRVHPLSSHCRVECRQSPAYVAVESRPSD